VTIYAWRKRFGQLMAVDVKRLLQLEAENARLKKMLVERVMDIEILNEVAAKNGTLQRGSTSFESRAADAEEVQTATECNNQPFGMVGGKQFYPLLLIGSCYDYQPIALFQRSMRAILSAGAPVALLER
jgi:hypothetical protein